MTYLYNKFKSTNLKADTTAFFHTFKQYFLNKTYVFAL